MPDPTVHRPLPRRHRPRDDDTGQVVGVSGYVPKSAPGPTPPITRSRARCLDCGDVIESKHRHDFVSCSCGALHLDGGTTYVRYLYRDIDRVELLTEYGSADA